MRKCSFLRALTLAALLAAPQIHTALADTDEQQAMHQSATLDADPAPSNGTGPYDTPTPPFGD